MHISDELLNIRSARMQCIIPGEIFHRPWVIVRTAELEVALGEKLLAWLQDVNPALDVEQARVQLLTEGPLNSPKKAAEMCFHAGLIGPKTKHDLRKIVSIRDRYAHDARRGQMAEEPALLKLITDTYLYRDNIERFRALPDSHEQRALIAVVEGLQEIIRAGHVE